MHPPRPIPSKNWWKDKAISSGFIVAGLCDAPSDIPMTTECTTIPNSKTYSTAKRTLQNWKKRRKKTVCSMTGTKNIKVKHISNEPTCDIMRCRRISDSLVPCAV